MTDRKKRFSYSAKDHWLVQKLKQLNIRKIVLIAAAAIIVLGGVALALVLSSQVSVEEAMQEIVENGMLRIGLRTDVAGMSLSLIHISAHAAISMMAV